MLPKIVDTLSAQVFFDDNFYHEDILKISRRCPGDSLYIILLFCPSKSDPFPQPLYYVNY